MSQTPIRAGAGIRSVFIYLGLSILLSGCFFFSSSKDNLPLTIEELERAEKSVERIYVQSITGPNREEFQELFFETVDEQEVFTFLNTLPDDYNQLTIMRLEIIDSNIWDNSEPIEQLKEFQQISDSTSDVIKRRNALISVKVSLFAAASGNLLLRKLYSQPFQQIYVESDTLKSLSDIKTEKMRLTKSLIYRILADIHSRDSEPKEMDLEIGHGWGFISRYLLNLGEDRIKKGNRLAQDGNYERAIWIWRLVLYRPNEGEPIDVYKLNRASAYYNLGQVFSQKKQWLEAARMFSLANRLKQSMKYAQAWGNSLQSWLDEKKILDDYVDNLSPKKDQDVDKKEKLAPLTVESATAPELKDSEKLIFIEANEQLLLKPRELWPLEPALEEKEKKTNQKEKLERVPVEMLE